MGRKYFVILIAIAFVFALNLSAQSNSDKIKKSDELLLQKDYEGSESLLKEVLSENPVNNFARYKLALLYHTTENFERAVEEYEILAPNNNPTVLYNLGCAYSRLNKKKEALEWLRKAIESGFTQIATVKTDPDLENVRSEKEFGDIVKSIKTLENFPEASKFDFWVGEWNVYDPQKTKRGESRIEKILKNAAILENWFGGSGYVGKSFNHYDMDRKKWVQYWVDQNSQAIMFEGNFDETQNAVVFFSYDKTEKDSGYIRRLRFFNLAPDTVRQFSEQSKDEGKTWFTEYDFYYVRKTE